MTNKEVEERVKTLEQRIIDIDEKLMGHMAVSKDRYMLTNDRINEAIRQKFITEYDYGKLCKYWYDLFSNLNSIKVDEE